MCVIYAISKFYVGGSCVKNPSVTRETVIKSHKFVHASQKNHAHLRNIYTTIAHKPHKINVDFVTSKRPQILHSSKLNSRKDPSDICAHRGKTDEGNTYEWRPSRRDHERPTRGKGWWWLRDTAFSWSYHWMELDRVRQQRALSDLNSDLQIELKGAGWSAV